MKRSILGLLIPSFSISAVFLMACSLMAQVPEIGYRLHSPVMPAGSFVWTLRELQIVTAPDGTPLHVFAVGSYQRSDRPGKSAFVYDHFGFIDPAQPERFWDVEELVGPLPLDTETTFRDINFAGAATNAMRISGLLIENGGDADAFYIDLFPVSSQSEIVPIEIPVPTVGHVFPRSVNEDGLILVDYNEQDPGNPNGIDRAFILDPLSGATTNVQFPFQSYSLELNRWLEVIGKRTDGIIVRHTIGVGTEEFPGLSDATSINDSSQFAATLSVPGRGNRVDRYGIRIGANGAEERRWRDANHSGQQQVKDMNANGDCINNSFGAFNNFLDTVSYFHEGEPANPNDQVFVNDVKTLVIPESDPTGELTQLGWGNSDFVQVSDRDSTGWGWIAVPTFNIVNNSAQRQGLVLLIPKVPTSRTFSKTHNPALAIPDNNTTGVTSNLAVTDNLRIASVSVTFNISHPRPSDLRVYLTGPNNVSVELSNFGGANNVNNFNGTFTAGNWKLKVVDSAKKKTGTLNSWSITIEPN